MSKILLSLAILSFGFVVSANEADVWMSKASVELKDELKKVSLAVDEYCSGSIEIEELQKSLAPCMQTWQRFSVINIAPTQERLYKMSFQFFPDKKGRIEKKLTSYLVNGLEVDEKGIANRVSFLVGGVSALEVLLFEDREVFKKTIKGNKDSFCKLLKNIPENLLVKQVLFEEDLKVHRSQGDEKTWDADILNSLIFSLEEIKKSKIDYPINFEKKHIFPHRFESQRSKASLENIKNNTIASRELFEAIFKGPLLAKNEFETIDFANKSYEQILDILSSFDKPLTELEVDADDFARVEKLKQTVSFLISLLKRRVAVSLGLPLYFNGTDGD